MNEQDSDHSLPSLPDGILLDILSRLPTKPLHRLKTVSTTFRRWISGDAYFLRLHALRSAATPRRRVAVLASHAPPSSVVLHSLSASTVSVDTLSAAPLSGDFKYSYPAARIWNSCNGLVLISISDKTFFVWNPSTREKEILCFVPPRTRNYSLLGLGYDKVDGEFKLVSAYRTGGAGDSCFMVCSSLRIGEKESPSTVGKQSGSCDAIVTEEQNGEKEEREEQKNGMGSWDTVVTEEQTGGKEEPNQNPSTVGKQSGSCDTIVTEEQTGEKEEPNQNTSTVGKHSGSRDTIITEEQTGEKGELNRNADSPANVGKHLGSWDTVVTEEQTEVKEVLNRNGDSPIVTEEEQTGEKEGPSTVGKHSGSWGTVVTEEEQTGEKEGNKEQRNRTHSTSRSKNRVRKIGDFPYRICRDMRACEVGGDLYWMVAGYLAIIGFDFRAEVFYEMAQLHWDPGVSKYRLGVLGGSLCVACHGEDNVEVLGLKKESWEKLFVVPYDAGGVQFRTLVPLCFTGDGEVVMEVDGKRLVVYNVGERTCRLLSCLPLEEQKECQETPRTRQGLRVNGSGFKVVVYEESLVSPSGSSESIKNLCSKVQQQLRLG